MAAGDGKTKGKVEEAKGKGKQAWGDVSEDEEKQAEGTAEEQKGKARQKWDEAKDWVKEQTGEEEEKQ